MLLSLGLLIATIPSAVFASDTLEQPSMKVVGELPLFEPEVAGRTGGRIVINPRSRRGYQISDSTEGTAGAVTVIWSFDLDTLQPIRRATIPVTLVKGTLEGDLVHAVDEEDGRLFFATLSPPGLPPFQIRFPQTNIVVVDEKSLEQGNSPFVTFWPILNSQAADFPVGMTFSREGGQAKLLVALELAGPTLALSNLRQEFLVQINAPVGGQSITAGGEDWRVSLGTACGRMAQPVGGEGTGYQREPLRRAGAVYLACEGQGTPGGSTYGPALVIKVPIVSTISGSSPDSANIQTFGLPRRIGAVLVDRRWGRIIVEAAYGGSTLWVFDTNQDAWVGGIGLLQAGGQFSSMGIDKETGRLYTLVPHHVLSSDPPQPIQGGFQFSDLGITPSPQLTNFLPELAYPGHLKIVVDPEGPGRPRRIFLRRGHPTAFSTYEYPGTNVVERRRESFYTIIEDYVPIVSPPSLAEVDRNTINREEEQGVTAANFEAMGSGYGMRMLWLAGVNGITSNTYRDNIHVAGCLEYDREFVVVGWAHSAKLSTLSTSARGVSFDTDLSTRDDLKSPATRCWSTLTTFVPPPSATGTVDSQVGEEWKDFTAECVGTREDTSVQGAPGKFTQGAGRFQSEARCKENEGKVETSAFGFLGIGGSSTPLKVASAFSKVEVRRDPMLGGVLVAVTSIAQGIEFPPIGLSVKAGRILDRIGRLKTGQL